MPGKRKRKDVAEFSLYLSDNLWQLHNDLKNKTYRHGGYQSFKICDPKPREIHKASVCDRLVHHAVCRILFPFFDRKFVFNSFSCRKGKGTHLAMDRFRSYAGKVSKNNTRACWVLKCDIRKFFANIDHKILLEILAQQVKDQEILWLLSEIIESFNSKDKVGVGLPLGNLTSQLLINVYMNEFDQFVLRELKAKYYIRYADDFLALSSDRTKLEMFLPKIAEFLTSKLKLELNLKKVEIKTFASGVDFLGWVHFPDHRVLRRLTKRRMLAQVSNISLKEILKRYSGLLCHGNTWKIKSAIIKINSSI
ncbi:MAG: reverse transcriptase domain-containing protein [Candidatus Berkelbacteria bacterium]|nr:reverse transcriptase domain-containing protein [Candidatus Berkelbacteria bacterium]